MNTRQSLTRITLSLRSFTTLADECIVMIMDFLINNEYVYLVKLETLSFWTNQRFTKSIFFFHNFENALSQFRELGGGMLTNITKDTFSFDIKLVNDCILSYKKIPLRD